MQIEKHCFELFKGCDKMDSLGSMAMPETSLIKAFDQQLKALANKVSISYAEQCTYSYTDWYTV